MRFVRAALLVMLAVAMAVVLGGCTRQKTQAVQPQVTPPAIGQAGVLRAGIDLSSPPFGGRDVGREAGIDVDVAAALAEKLGLQLKVVDMTPDQASSALKAGKVDVVLSVPLSGTSLSDVSIAGTYIDDGPVFFSKVASGTSEATVTIDSVGGRVVGAQTGSPAYWALAQGLGEDAVRAYPSLREAFEAASGGTVDLVAGDAVTGSYIARDFPGFKVAGSVGTPTLLGVAVAQKNTALEQKVRSALDGLAADGILNTIRSKWVGQMPVLTPAASSTVSP